MVLEIKLFVRNRHNCSKGKTTLQLYHVNMMTKRKKEKRLLYTSLIALPPSQLQITFFCSAAIFLKDGKFDEDKILNVHKIFVI